MPSYVPEQNFDKLLSFVRDYLVYKFKKATYRENLLQANHQSKERTSCNGVQKDTYDMDQVGKHLDAKHTSNK